MTPSSTVLDSEATQRLLLQNVSWDTYRNLLRDLGDHRSVRLSYDRGILELMSPSFAHENLNRVLNYLVVALARRFKPDFVSAGSTTFAREGTSGVEPASSFYFENAARIRGKKTIDLATDPPPELVIEVDITSPSLRRFSIYAALGVAEIWRYDGSTLDIWHLQPEGRYLQQPQSLSFPVLSEIEATQLLQQAAILPEPQLLDLFDTWARERSK
ncbi:Uma2 family endonuclease [Gloeobacter violaceus]|uniref:Glr0602 protein n=1 Tax=Gloeobacter violaceus (strain ATCC 29082 / PCC 7421) TaxID=251221 RepID=Q7NN12_GLOVI|nr:Uma2 family endonuclease [Gloeobacter violaceus]BAC88543.1 glr0602 [Gloeobacter violaceus PCC 7421]